MVKVPAYSAGDLGLIPGLGRFSGEGNGPTPVLLPRKFHGRRSLVSMESQRVRHKETWVLSLGQGRSTPVFLLGQYHGQSSVAGYSPWGCKELDTTEWLSTWIYINYIKNRNLHPFDLTLWWGSLKVTYRCMCEGREKTSFSLPTPCLLSSVCLPNSSQLSDHLEWPNSNPWHISTYPLFWDL